MFFGIGLYGMHYNGHPPSGFGCGGYRTGPPPGFWGNNQDRDKKENIFIIYLSEFYGGNAGRGYGGGPQHEFWNNCKIRQIFTKVIAFFGRWRESLWV